MKRKLNPFLCAVLLPALLLSLSCGGGEQSAGTDTGTAGATAEADGILTLVGNGADCRIIVPVGDSDALTVAYRLRTAILDATGVKLTVGKDSSEAAGCEILIGKTNRAASQVAYRNIGGEGDWSLSIADECAVLSGGSGDALQIAADCLLSDGLSGKTLPLPRTYVKGESREYRVLLRDGTSEYVLVVGKKDDEAAGFAYALRTRIEEMTGVRLRQVWDGEPPVQKEILIGKTDRPESESVRERFVTEQDWYVGLFGEKLVIDGGDSDALEKAVNWFLSTYLSKQTDLISLPLGMEQHYICRFEKPEELAKQINNIPAGEIKRLQSVERADVYTPTDAWFYSHHQAISKIGDRYIAVWSRGRQNEDDCGQHIAWAWSTDFNNWSAAEPLVDVRRGESSELVMQLSGIYNSGSKLTVYFQMSEYDESQLRENGSLRPVDDGNNRFTYSERWYMTTEDGIHWSEPARLFPDSFPRSAGGNHGPVLLSNGELFWPGNVFHAYTEDLTGIHWDGTSFTDRELAISKGAKHLCECSVYERDGVLYLLCRTNNDELWVCFSEDWGRTWSDPNPTKFTDAGAKFMCGRLPDGRYYIVSNPVPKSNRNPLVISISKDGLNFDEQYLIGDEPYTQLAEGMYKGGDYGYPCTYIGDDGYFYVIYSRGKEAVQVTRFLLSEIGVQ